MYREERREMKRTTPRFVSSVEEKTVSWKFFKYIYIYRSGILWRPPLANPFVGILRLDGAVPPNCQLRFYYTRVSYACTKYVQKNIFKGQLWCEFSHRESSTNGRGETRRVQLSRWKFDFFSDSFRRYNISYLMREKGTRADTANILLLRWKR